MGWKGVGFVGCNRESRTRFTCSLESTPPRGRREELNNVTDLNFLSIDTVRVTPDTVTAQKRAGREMECALDTGILTCRVGGPIGMSAD